VLGGPHTVTLHAKMLRLELFNVKADFERDLGRLVLDCASCGRRVHWIPGLGVTLGTGRIGSQRRSRTCRLGTPFQTDSALRRRLSVRGPGCLV
jgi:hypothetical protein